MAFLVVLVGFCLWVSSCLGGARAPLTSPEDSLQRESLLRDVVDRIALAMEREDLRALQEVFSSLFTSVDPNLAVRFRPGTDGGDPSTFFGNLFKNNENISASFTVQDVEITGDVGVVNAEFSFSAVYVLDLPPTTYESRTSDILVFQVEDGMWKLISWAEKVEGGGEGA